MIPSWIWASLEYICIIIPLLRTKHETESNDFLFYEQIRPETGMKT